jgi:hypothetical protein
MRTRLLTTPLTTRHSPSPRPDARRHPVCALVRHADSSCVDAAVGAPARTGSFRHVGALWLCVTTECLSLARMLTTRERVRCNMHLLCFSHALLLFLACAQTQAVAAEVNKIGESGADAAAVTAANDRELCSCYVILFFSFALDCIPSDPTSCCRAAARAHFHLH